VQIGNINRDLDGKKKMHHRWKKIDNILVQSTVEALETIIGSFSLLCALAWNNVILDLIKKEESVSAFGYAGIVTGVWFLVMVGFELLKLYFINDIIKSVKENDGKVKVPIVKQLYHQ
tara:strand:- start:291 stop:644 length:354 start_codon:yes stop_codon:yes gene_type:complete